MGTGLLSTTAGFALNKVDALGSKIADTAGAGSALERQAGKVAKIAGHTGMALDVASGIYDGVRDPKHADEAAAQTAGSIAGGVAGGALGGLTGPFAPVATPVLATAGGLAGGYVAGKAYPVAKQLIKDNPIGAALGAPLGPFGMVAGGLGQKGVESAAPYVHKAFDTADHLATSSLHEVSDVAGGAKDALGDAAGGVKDFVGGFI